MRINEITDAQGQLELLRTIIDNTWTAIAQQAEQERRAEAERKAKSKLKPRSRKAVKAPYSPPPPPLKKPKPTLSKTPPPPNNVPNPNNDNTITPVRNSAKPLDYEQPNSNPQLNPMPIFNPNTLPEPPQKASIAPKDGYLGKNMGAIKKDGNGDDRHSKNGIVNPNFYAREKLHRSTYAK
jgi:hypothetical protein